MPSVCIQFSVLSLSLWPCFLPKQGCLSFTGACLSQGRLSVAPNSLRGWVSFPKPVCGLASAGTLPPSYSKPLGFSCFLSSSSNLVPTWAAPTTGGVFCCLLLNEVLGILGMGRVSAQEFSRLPTSSRFITSPVPFPLLSKYNAGPGGIPSPPKA